MIIESGVATSADIFLCSKPTERNSLKRLIPLCLARHLVAAAVRKANIANQRVESAVLQKFQRALRRTRGSDFVPALGQESCQHMPRVRVVVDEKKPQLFRNTSVSVSRSGGDH